MLVFVFYQEFYKFHRNITLNWRKIVNKSFTGNVYTHIEMLSWFLPTDDHAHHDPNLTLLMEVSDLKYVYKT